VPIKSRKSTNEHILAAPEKLNSVNGTLSSSTLSLVSGGSLVYENSQNRTDSKNSIGTTDES
jgi:hypothetical protein